MSTSLVFLAVLGMWAAYLVQQWTRRHEHLAAARSSEAFQEAMRVLERPGGQTSAPATATPRTGASSSAATTAGAPRPRAVRPATRPAARPAGPSVRVRLVSLAATGTVALLALGAALLGLVGWVVPVAAILLVGIDVAYLRVTAVSARPAASRAAARGTAPARRAPARERVEVVRPETEPVPAPVVVDTPAEPVTAPAVEPEPARAEPAVARRRSPEPFDVRAFDEPVVAPEPAPAPAPGTWVPTPVPAPLYTRKARYQAPVGPAVAEPVAQVAATEPAAEAVTEQVVEPVEQVAPVVPIAERMVPVDIDDDVLEAESPYARVVNG